MATGDYGTPSIPDLSGQAEFAGRVLHAAGYRCTGAFAAAGRGGRRRQFRDSDRRRTRSRGRHHAGHPAPDHVAFDVLAHPAPGHPDLRPRSYTERHQALLDVLADVGAPIVPGWSTTDRG
ncbi:hypothetical protein ABZ235_35935 [Streptomyces canus]|uniref:hypothetical protein n=1 Tax=Streptomyces canus TaxID=58343 RepID=UPI0033B08AF9